MSTLGPSNRSPLAVTGWLLTAALVAFRLLPGLVQHGMFFDGVTYATISRNLAVGVGELAHPSLVPGDAGFYDSPPLGFLLEAEFFRALGDHYWVEKLYSTLTGVVTAGLIVAIWRRLLGDRGDLRRMSWLPVALWVAVPGWGWMYSNNMLENTLGMFAVLAVYAVLRASVGWLIIGAVAIAAAVLSKGPVGLYPLATPLVAYVTLRRKALARAIVETIALVALFCGVIGLVCLLPGAAEYFDKYLHGQVLAAMQGRREVVNSILGRFDILWKVVQQVILPLAIAAGLVWTARRNGWMAEPAVGALPNGGATPPEGGPTPRPAIAFCLLTGVSASAPIVASLKQSGHYAFPSYAFFALALALRCAPAVAHLLTAASAATLMRRHRFIRYASVATLVLLVVASGLLFNRPRRDGEAYHDALVLGQVVPKASMLGISRDLATDFPLLTNLARWDFIGGDPVAEGHRFFLARNSEPPPAGYVEVPTDMSHYRLFERASLAEAAK
jgi:4-amino-4-deoxy-L-arabinose transferase-like glycosyltransferase